ncbi:bacteriocin immunity protein [Enterobacteriaceae bacterium C34A]
MAIKKLESYTESEFLDFVKKICSANFPTENEHDEAIWEFAQVTEYPEGWNVIYHPKPGTDNSPAGVVKTVKEWRAANGKPGFKSA